MNPTGLHAPERRREEEAEAEYWERKRKKRKEDEEKARRLRLEHEAAFEQQRLASEESIQRQREKDLWKTVEELGRKAREAEQMHREIEQYRQQAKPRPGMRP